jgi:uncharacterized repeat protein (TIGR03803 family)
MLTTMLNSGTKWFYGTLTQAGCFAACLIAAGGPTHAATYNQIYVFPESGVNGDSPYGGLTNIGGTLYGTTEYGGATDDGVVFKVTPAGAQTVLYSFKGGSDGNEPEGTLLHVGDALYGSTFNGSTVFKVTKSGKEKIIYKSPLGEDINDPVAGLINVGGTFYGTSQSGGTYDNGTVFSVTPSGTEKVIYSFQGGADGANPFGDLIKVGNDFYGTTVLGGASNRGTVFKVTASGQETVLYSFKGGTDGANPYAGLVEVGGTFYGTTTAGGDATGDGTIFSVTEKGVEQVIHVFQGHHQNPATYDGATPYAGLINVGGILYGTTYGGGGAETGGCGCGTVFSVTTAGVETVLYDFGGNNNGDGEFPYASLINVGGTLYGTTSVGGDYRGTVFSITP